MAVQTQSRGRGAATQTRPAPQQRPAQPAQPTQALATVEDKPAPPAGFGTTPDADRLGRMIERVMLAGNIEALSPHERVRYMVALAQTLGLNPHARPFDIIKGEGGKLVLYINKSGVEQLAGIHKISTEVVAEAEVRGRWRVRMRASKLDGQFAEATASVQIEGLNGVALDNAMMKAETKARRRSILGIQGLGWFDRLAPDDGSGERVLPDRHGNPTRYRDGISGAEARAKLPEGFSAMQLTEDPPETSRPRAAAPATAPVVEDDELPFEGEFLPQPTDEEIAAAEADLATENAHDAAANAPESEEARLAGMVRDMLNRAERVKVTLEPPAMFADAATLSSWLDTALAVVEGAESSTKAGA